MKNCLFCSIVNQEIESTTVLETENTLAFHDIHKDAPVHVLVIPKKHISSLNDLKDKDQALMGELLMTAQKVAGIMNISQDGYRCIINTNNNGGQVIKHIHLHVLGGKPLGRMIQKDLKK